MNNNFVLSLQIKHQLLYLCNTYFGVLYEMQSGIFLQLYRL